MDTNGQSLIGALVAITIITLGSLQLCKLMSSLTVAQARVQRSSNWNSMQNNITNILKNQTSCNATVLQLKTVSTTPQSLSVLVANGTALLANGSNLGYQLTNAKVSLVTVGASTPITVTATQTINSVTKTPCGQTDVNAVTTTVNVTEYIQQVQLAASAVYVPTGQPYAQLYYLNVVLDTNGNVLGCQI
jgi:hypothetical protein